MVRDNPGCFYIFGRAPGQQVLPDLRLGSFLTEAALGEEFELWHSGRMEDAFFAPNPEATATEGTKRKRTANPHASLPRKTAFVRCCNIVAGVWLLYWCGMPGGG